VLGALAVGGLAVLLLPFLVGPSRRARRMTLWIGAAAIIGMAVLTILALGGEGAVTP
jgi:hypothetical protein